MSSPVFKVAALVALFSTTAAQAAPSTQCLTREEIGGMVGYLLPSALNSVIDTCTPELAADAFLLSRGPKLIEELEPIRLASLPMAKRAFGKFAPEGDKQAVRMLQALPDEVFAPLVDSILTQELTGKIQPKSCKDIDRVFKTIEPLPGQNMIDLLTESMMIVARNDDRMRSCPET